MTEEIIIDGVNVAECEYFAKQNEHSCLEENGNCKNISDCNYKQLKRAGNRIKDLEERIINHSNEIEKYCTRLANKEQENKEIYENGQIEITKLCNEKTKYRSAIEEINILAKNYCNACDEFKAKTYKNKNDCLYCNYGFIKRKINQVLNHSES